MPKVKEPIAMLRVTSTPNRNFLRWLKFDVISGNTVSTSCITGDLSTCSLDRPFKQLLNLC